MVSCKMQIFRGTEFQIFFAEQHNSKHNNQLMYILKVLLVGGYLVNVGSGLAENLQNSFPDKTSKTNQ